MREMSRAGKWLLMASLALSVLVGDSGAAEPSKVVELWPAEPPGEKGAVGEEHDTTKSDGRTVAGKRVTRIGNVSRPTLSIFRPAPEKDTGSAVMVCPGGGYNIVAIDLEGTEVCEWLNSVGVTAGLLKYRVPKRAGDDSHTLPLQDAQRALGLLRHRARDWGVATNRIGALGFSAGGHLVASLSNNYDKRAYPVIDDADKESCRPDFAVLIYPGYLVSKENDKVAAELMVSDRTPPTFLVMAADDPVRVENVLCYSLALRKAKVPFELHVYPEGGHGYGLRPQKDLPVTTWPLRLADWMRVQNLLPAAKISQPAERSN